MVKKTPAKASKLLGLLELFGSKIVEHSNKLDDLHKMLVSHQEMLAEHQRVLRILYNESPDKKSN